MHRMDEFDVRGRTDEDDATTTAMMIFAVTCFLRILNRNEKGLLLRICICSFFNIFIEMEKTQVGPLSLYVKLNNTATQFPLSIRSCNSR